MAKQRRQWDILDSETLAVERGVDERELVRRAKAGKLKLNDCVRPTGTEAWRRVDQITQLAELVRRAQRKEAPRRQPSQVRRPTPVAAAPPPTEAPASEPKAEPTATLAIAPEEGQEDDDRISFRPPRTADVPVDLTPMVDVTFQLLLFFMLTATFTLQKSIELPNPAEQQGTATLQQLLRENIVIEVDRNNVYWVDDQKVDADELVRRLTQIRRRQNKTSAIIIGTEDSSHGAVVTALDAAQEAGIENLILAPPKKAPKTRAFFGRRRRGG